MPETGTLPEQQHYRGDCTAGWPYNNSDWHSVPVFVFKVNACRPQITEASADKPNSEHGLFFRDVFIDGLSQRTAPYDMLHDSLASDNMLNAMPSAAGNNMSLIPYVKLSQRE
jgi:hypothetical protein